MPSVFRRRPPTGTHRAFDILEDNFDRLPDLASVIDSDLADDRFGPEPIPTDVVRVCSAPDLDPMVLLGLTVCVEQCWADGVTEPHLVLAAVMGRATELGVAIADPAGLYDHPELGPWLRDEWPTAPDALAAVADEDNAAWQRSGVSPSQRMAWERAGVFDPDVVAEHVAAGRSPDAVQPGQFVPEISSDELCTAVGHLLYQGTVTATQAHRMLRSRNLIRTSDDRITVLDHARAA